MAKDVLTRKQYKNLKMRTEKLKYKKKKNEKNHKLNPKHDAMIKLSTLNSIIGYLVRKGADSGLPMEILLDIANDYEKKVSEN